MRRALAAAAALLAIGAHAEPPRYDKPELAGVVLSTELGENSGFAASLRRDGLLWALNDNQNPNRIYALEPSGAVLARYEVEGVPNIDWEDLASFELDGKPYLLIADVGDNNGVRQELRLIVAPEPEPSSGQDVGKVAPLYVTRVRYPDGPRDCEAVAVDPARNEVLLLSKRRVPAQLFVVPLRPEAGAADLVTARQVAHVDNIPQPTPEEIAQHPRAGRYLGEPTAMALRPDGREIAVLTYRDVYVYERRPGESWQDTFARKPVALGIPPLPQGEALTYSRGGDALYASGERLPAPIVRIARTSAASR